MDEVLGLNQQLSIDKGGTVEEINVDISLVASIIYKFLEMNNKLHSVLSKFDSLPTLYMYACRLTTR